MNRDPTTTHRGVGSEYQEQALVAACEMVAGVAAPAGSKKMLAGTSIIAVPQDEGAGEGDVSRPLIRRAIGTFGTARSLDLIRTARHVSLIRGNPTRTFPGTSWFHQLAANLFIAVTAAPTIAFQVFRRMMFRAGGDAEQLGDGESGDTVSTWASLAPSPPALLRGRGKRCCEHSHCTPPFEGLELVVMLTDEPEAEQADNDDDTDLTLGAYNLVLGDLPGCVRSLQRSAQRGSVPAACAAALITATGADGDQSAVEGMLSLAKFAELDPSSTMIKATAEEILKFEPRLALAGPDRMTDDRKIVSISASGAVTVTSGDMSLSEQIRQAEETFKETAEVSARRAGTYDRRARTGYACTLVHQQHPPPTLSR